MKNGFIKVAAASPVIRVCDCDYNADRVIETIEKADERNSAFLTHGSQVLSGMMTASQEQSDFMADLKTAQQDIREGVPGHAAQL